MNRTMMKSKIHRATVTGACLDYVGSITIDKALLEASGLFKNMLVKINNIRNGISWETYILEGEEHKGEIKLNGPPANHFQPGDIVIILGYVGGAPLNWWRTALGQAAAAYYFLHFLVILPIVSELETPLPLPSSISESVLHGEEAEAAPMGQTKRRGGSVATASAE